MKRIDKLRDIFQKLALPPDRLLIAGSSPLSLFDIVKEGDLSDFDVLVMDPELWEKVRKLGKPVDIKTKTYSGECVLYTDQESGEVIEFTNSWPMSGKSNDKLYEKRMIVNGLSFMSLDHVIRSKIIMDREKDRRHLSLMRTWLHTVKLDDNNDVPDGLKKRVYRDIARGLASGLSLPANVNKKPSP